MNKAKGLLFDFNGTLFFDSVMHVIAFNRTCEKYGIEPFSEQYLISNIFGRGSKELFLDYIKADATERECEEFAMVKKNFYYDACLENKDAFHLTSGVTEMLDCLKEMGVPYALVTGSDREEVDFFIRHFGLDRWFSYEKNIVYFDGSYKGKPAPDCYLIAAKRIGVPTSDCIVFEDGRAGKRAAIAAGCRVIAVHERGFPSPAENGDVLAEYNGFEEWKAILSEII